MNKPIKTVLLPALLTFSFTIQAGEEKLLENPSDGGLLKDTFAVSYVYDDFSEEIQDANVLFIPADYRSEAAFFMRCRPYFTNFSVEFLEQQTNLANRDGRLENDSPDYAKHGYVYDTKHNLKMTTDHQSKKMAIAVGGQNNHLNRHFESDIEKTPGLLGMSFHVTFNYTEMPAFRPVGNSASAKDVHRLLKRALQRQTPLIFELDGRNAPDRTFTLDTKRMQTFVPPQVIDFCVSNRQLRE